MLFGGYFIMNGLTHFFKLKDMTSYAHSKKVPMPKFLVIVSGLLIFLGGVGILIGFLVPFAVLAIEIFLVFVTALMHDFWNVTDKNIRMVEYVNFTKNLALMGGALAFLFI